MVLVPDRAVAECVSGAKECQFSSSTSHWSLKLAPMISRSLGVAVVSKCSTPDMGISLRFSPYVGAKTRSPVGYHRKSQRDWSVQITDKVDIGTS